MSGAELEVQPMCKYEYWWQGAVEWDWHSHGRRAVSARPPLTGRDGWDWGERTYSGAVILVFSCIGPVSLSELESFGKLVCFFFFWPVLLTHRSLLVCCWQDLWAGDRPSSDGAHLGQWSVARTAQPQAWSVQGKTHRTHPQTLTQLSVLHIKHRLVEFATAEGGSVEEERQDPGWTLGAHGSSLSPQHFSACALNCLFPRPMWCWILIAAHFLHIQHALTDKGHTGVSPGHARTLDIHSSPAHLPCNQWTSCFFSFVTYWLATQPYCGENYFSSPCFDIIAATLQCYSFLPVCLLLFISSIKRLQRVTISAGRL